MKKTVITYGLISGAIAAVAMVVMCVLLKNKGFNNSMIFGYAGMLLAFLVIYPAMVSYRNNMGGGQIKFGRALAIGFLITVISSVVYSITWMIVSKIMLPDFMEKFAAHAIDQLKEKGASAAEISKKTEEMKNFAEMYANPVYKFLLTCMEPLPMGVVVSLICAGIVRRKKKG